MELARCRTVKNWACRTTAGRPSDTERTGQRTVLVVTDMGRDDGAEEDTVRRHGDTDIITSM